MEFKIGDTIKGGSKCVFVRPSFVVSISIGKENSEKGKQELYLSSNEMSLHTQKYGRVTHEGCYTHYINNPYWNINYAKMVLTERCREVSQKWEKENV